MAYSCGFFNSKGLDRTYTAEDFTTYLSSIICNGILDTYGKCFELTAMPTGLRVRLGTGKAWINGHYFVNDAPQTIDLKEYQDESLPRYVGIAIVCDVSEEVRDVYLEITPGTPAEYPSLPTYPTDANKTRLLMYGVRLNVGADSLTERDWYDYREDGNVCGYCRCILGKCKVTDMLSQLAQIEAEMETYNATITEMTTKIDVLQTKVDDLTGDIIETGEFGENIYYVLYSNGKLLLRGTGETYDYTSSLETPKNESPLKKNMNVKNLVVSEGITSLGNFTLPDCDNLETASLPNSLVRIGRNSLTATPDEKAEPTVALGLKSVTIPENVTEIGAFAFADTRLESIRIPKSVKTVGRYCFQQCIYLETVRCESEQIGEFMFVWCRKLKNVTIAETVKEICSHCFNYCESLTALTYEGSLEDWAKVTKRSNWDSHSASISVTNLTKIQCLDGHLDWDEENKEWVEVKE